MAEQAVGASTPPVTQENSASSESQVKDTTAAPDPEPWKKVKHKIKVDKEDVELDWDSLVKEAQKGRASDKRFQEVAKFRKELQDTWNSADPSTFFKAKNLDPEKWAEDLLLKKIKFQQMTPEQREAYEKEEKSKAERDREKGELEQLRQERQQLITQQFVQKLDGEIVDAFKAIDMKPNPVLIKRMAERMEAYMDAHEGEMLPASEALKAVLGDRDSDTKGFLEGLTAKQLRELLPKKLLDELRKEDVELVRSQSPLAKQSSNGAKPSTPAAKAKRASTEDFFKALEQKLG